MRDGFLGLRRGITDAQGLHAEPVLLFSRPIVGGQFCVWQAVGEQPHEVSDRGPGTRRQRRVPSSTCSKARPSASPREKITGGDLAAQVRLVANALLTVEKPLDFLVSM